MFSKKSLQELEVLTVLQIHDLTGYLERLIGRWIRSRCLSAVGRFPYCWMQKVAVIRFFTTAQADPKFYYSDKFMAILGNVK